MRKALIIGALTLLGACAQPNYPAQRTTGYQAPQFDPRQPPGKVCMIYDENRLACGTVAEWRRGLDGLPPERADWAIRMMTAAPIDARTGVPTWNSVPPPVYAYTPTYTTPAPSSPPRFPTWGGGSSRIEDLEDQIQEMQDRIDDLEMQQMMNDDD